MGKSSKPRKQYRRREIHVPMQKETRDNLGLELRLAVEALIGAPSIDTYNQLTNMVSALFGSGITAESIELASRTLTLICDRFERVKKVGLSEIEKANLRASTAGLEEAIGKISMTKFRQSVAEVKIRMAIMEAA